MISAAVRRRQPIPDVIANAPQLFQGLEGYFEAFAELSTCRQNGMTMGPIPWLAINEYAKRHQYIGESFEYLVRMVRALDDTFLAYDRAEANRKKAEQESKANGGPSSVRETD